MSDNRQVRSSRATGAAGLATGGAVLVVGLGSGVAPRIGGLLVVLFAAGALWLFGNDRSAVLESSGDIGAQDRELVAQQTLRDIMRRRNAKICAAVGLMLLALLVVGYGPWSS
jgi:predicted metalloprotease